MQKGIFYNYRSNQKESEIKKISLLQNIEKKNVNINSLLNRVKVDQQSEKKRNIIFFSLGISLLGFMAIFVTIIR
jgi:hypothetical protein